MIAIIHVMVLGAFLSVCGLAMTEALLALQQILSARVFAFGVSVVVSWLLLDNVVLASDLARATQNTSTDGERELLRRLKIANRRYNLLGEELSKESAFHRQTAARLDQLEERRITSMNMLASETIIPSNIQKMVYRETEIRTRCLKRSMSDGWGEI